MKESLEKSQANTASPTESSKPHSTAQHVFEDIYQNDKWGGGQCKSGGGSLFRSTVVLRRELPNLFKKLNIQTLTDAGCGVGHWMEELAPLLTSYTGVDIVEAAVSKRKAENNVENMSFYHGNLDTYEFQKSDAIFSRDCLVHLSNDLAWQCIKNFKKSGSKYLMVTHYEIEAEENRDIKTGNWHEMDFTKPPFNFPDPVAIIDERESKGKKLAVFLLEDIPEPADSAPE